MKSKCLLDPSIRVVNNLRMTLDRMAVALEELATKGPIKPVELRGLENLDEYVKAEDLTVINGLKEMPPKTGVREVVDPQHYRTGWLLSEEMCKQYLEECMKAKQMVHKTQIDRKEFSTEEYINQQIDIFKGLVMMGYPGYYGLGAYEPIRMLLEEEADFDPRTTDWLDLDKTTIWVVSKELQPPKLFSDYFGKNEKQKFVVKLQSKGSGAPQREPALDQDTHKQMLSYYHKKQEEFKKLETDDSD